MIDPRHASFGWRKMESFCESMMELLMNTNQYRVVTFKSFYGGSDFNPPRGGVRDEGSYHPFKSSRVCAMVMLW
ncbi:hypothetical protein H5410_040906 [Solanum commersonii]|uniref:Uncharacterized protein n=1 Tax=Solanum commersonii TaxID=4109 RepID=A0A9J5XTA6_SOLCO|nr:hypothetical protein H5410_040906 [Solanum commersonii]